MSQFAKVFGESVPVITSNTEKKFPELRTRGKWRVSHARTGIEFVFICEPDFDSFVNTIRNLDPDFKIEPGETPPTGFFNVKTDWVIPSIIEAADPRGKLITVTVVWATHSPGDAALFEMSDDEIIRTIRHEIGHAVSIVPSKICCDPEGRRSEFIFESEKREIPAYISELMNSFVDCIIIKATNTVESGLTNVFFDAYPTNAAEVAQSEKS